MSGAYSLFRLQPVHVHGKGEVAPDGYVSDAQREMMEADQRGAGDALPTQSLRGLTDTPTPTSDPWGDLR